MAKKDISNKYVWNLKHFFDSIDDPRIEKEKKLVEKKSYKFINKWKDRTDYLEDPKILKEALDEYENWNSNYGADGKFGYYYWLSNAIDMENTELKAKINKVTEFGQKIVNDIQFFSMRIAKVDEKMQKVFLSSNELKDYKHYLKTSFKEAKYLLSEPEEKIVNIYGKTSFGNWVQMVDELLSKEEREIVDEKGKKIKKNFSGLISYIDSKKKKVRDDASKAMNSIFERWIDVAEIELNTVLENKRNSDKLRNVKRPDETRHLADDMDSEVVDALVEATTKRFDIPQRYYKLKAKLLKLPKLKYYEKSVPFGEVDKKYPIEESFELVAKVFKRLDPEFSEIFNDFVNEGRIDVFPRKGKTDGAFCTTTTIPIPIYILLNHNDKLRDVMTIAHEMGHGIHHTMSKVQNELNSGTTTSTAEVASTFMEDFVTQEIMKEADDELKLSLMMMKLNDEISTIPRQIGIYNFEADLHKNFREKGYLSKKDIGELFSKNMSAYLGKTVDMKGSENWWIYIGHIRRFFYVYTYASGLLISKSLQNFVKKDPKFIEKVKVFLSSGSKESPKDIFMKLGVDITDKTFWDKGLDEIENLLNETEKLAKKLGKI